jgi:hypothetical protein
MKFMESHFDEYINEVTNMNLHPNLSKLYYDKFPEHLEQFKNLIFFGPSGTGKYSQMLYAIKKYSPSNLKYDKKLILTYDKSPYCLKISDIHYEVDMSLLGCHSKLLWHEIYQQIIDILSTKQNKIGIIVCKNFHNINSELLDIFYSYMQDNNYLSFHVKYIILTEQVSFIPTTILNCCKMIYIKRPSKIKYKNCSKQKMLQNVELENIKNIKYLHKGITELDCPHKIICDKIINEILNVDNLKFLKFRDMLYDIFIYNLDITEIIWYIIHNLIKNRKIQRKHMSNILLKTNIFLKYFNNNYRPIYHLENFLFYLISTINEY